MDKQTDSQTHRTTTVTLAAHARRGLIIIIPFLIYEHLLVFLPRMRTTDGLRVYKLVRASVVLVVRTFLHAEPQTAVALAAMGRDLLVVAAVYAVLLFHIDQGTTFKHLAVIVTYVGYILVAILT